MGIWEWDFNKYCPTCKKITLWKGYNLNDDTGDHTHCVEHDFEFE